MSVRPFDTAYRWTDTPEKLKQMVSDLQAQPRVAVDTESNSLFAYRERVCLLQFSTPAVDYLVDPLALSDLSPLAPLFANPHIEKIFHAAEYDLICLRRDFNFRIVTLFDTMLASRILGRKNLGLGSLLMEFYGVDSNKKYQRADWGRRPLSEEQKDYARLDTHFLIPLRDQLHAQLNATGRLQLALEEFARLAAAPSPLPNRRNGNWQLPGSQRFTPRQKNVLRQLWLFREQAAEKRDVPPFKVLSNQNLLAIAGASPTSPQALRRVTGLSNALADRYQPGLLAAVQKGLHGSLPASPQPHHPRPSQAYLDRLEALRKWRTAKAHQLSLESDIILPRESMEAIAGANPPDLASLASLLGVQKWRLKQFGREILSTLTPKEQR
jgi:ribonuclease D